MFHEMSVPSFVRRPLVAEKKPDADFFSQYRIVRFKDSSNFKTSYKIQFWSYGQKTPDLKRSRHKEFRKTMKKF